MLHIHSTNAVSAWRETLLSLMLSGSGTDNTKYYRDDFVVIELEQPSIEPLDSLFPMVQTDIDTINQYIVSGENEKSVVHEWTKLYYHRMFDQPHSQIEFILEMLSLPEPVGEAQMSLWDKSIDQSQLISPCTSIIWARKKRNRLELHVHAHSSDAYKKLLMNMQEFIAIQYYLTERLNITVGKYFHVIDSCHIHGEDLQACLDVLSQLSLKIV